METESTRDGLLREVNDFLKMTGMGSTTLGLYAGGNGHLVKRLRAGGDVKTATADQLRAFMLDWRSKR
jgi:hypothetical protein